MIGGGNEIDADCYLSWLKVMFPNLDYEKTQGSRYAQTLRQFLQKAYDSHKVPLSTLVGAYPNTLPTSVLTVPPVDEVESEASFVTELLRDVDQLVEASTSLLEGDHVKPKDEDLVASVGKKLDSLAEKKESLSSLEREKLRVMDDILTGMLSSFGKGNQQGEQAEVLPVQEEQEQEEQEQEGQNQDQEA
mgnify:CR=1 FL=1